MKPVSAVRATLLSVAISFALAGCGDSNEMSQDDIQYLSHIDQSRFFQRQGVVFSRTWRFFECGCRLSLLGGHD